MTGDVVSTLIGGAIVALVGVVISGSILILATSVLALATRRRPRHPEGDVVIPAAVAKAFVRWCDYYPDTAAADGLAQMYRSVVTQRGGAW